MDELRQQLLERLKAIEQRLDALDASQSQLKDAYARSRAHLRRLWLRPPMWTYEQHPPRPLDLRSLPAPPALPKQPPRIAIVTASFNHGRFLRATIDTCSLKTIRGYRIMSRMEDLSTTPSIS
ncbi:hypothetical protein [Bradyrhizobium sp. AZCC 2289]|uniref:hypothetical protein n=1 Tax=Bradyrhizobium sp. AZCC 2289 TaxID=3117026 RepID=UPI002FEFA529